MVRGKELSFPADTKIRRINTIGTCIFARKIGNFRRPNAGTSPGIPGDSRTYPESPLTHQAPSEGIFEIGRF